MILTWIATLLSRLNPYHDEYQARVEAGRKMMMKSHKEQL